MTHEQQSDKCRSEKQQSAEQQSIDDSFMRRALDLARNGYGWTNPNPMVGAVIVKDGRIIGEGWHTKCGNLHAEREAFAHCSEDPQGATLYVTLEPCCHWGKTPPCTETIIKHNIARVVMGAPDPNPLVAGKGINQLREAGIEVSENVLLQECLDINKVFFRFIQTKRPYVVVKYAMTLDGKIATKTGASQWITGESARAHVHTQRHRFSAIMVGIRTVLSDDPMLTARLDEGKDLITSWKTESAFMEDPFPDRSLSNNPIRIVLDSSLQIPLHVKLVTTAKEIPTIIATLSTDGKRIVQLQACGCEVIVTRSCNGKVDLQDLMGQLGQRGIDSVYVEGGATVHAALIESGLVDEVHAYVAPKIFGGRKAPGPVGGEGVEVPAEAMQFVKVTSKQFGQDFLFECEVS